MGRIKISVIIALILSAACIFPSAGTTPSKFPSQAEWIGTLPDSLPLRTSALSVFRIDAEMTVAKGDTVELRYGIADQRLANADLNPYHLASDSSYIAVTLSGSGDLRLSRHAYHPTDSGGTTILGSWKANLEDTDSVSLSIRSNLGHTDIFLNGSHTGYRGIKPEGNGGDFIDLPIIGDLAVKLYGSPTVNSLAVRNLRAPSAILYSAPSSLTASTDIKLPSRSLPLLRSEFTIPAEKSIVSATLTATARGIYTARVNRQPVAHDYFLPGATQYDRTLLFHTFDITDLVTQGKNAIDVQLAEGWWSGPATYEGSNWNFFGDRQSFAAQIDIVFTDGSCLSLPTSSSTWEVSTDGPLLLGSFFQGEIFDPHRLRTAHWMPATTVPAPDTTVTLRPTFGDRVLPFDTLTSISVSEPRPGVFIYDMGVNLAGVPYITLPALPDGTRVSLRYAEMLYPDSPLHAENAGLLMTENLRAAQSHDIYIYDEEKSRNIISPTTTFHGFRYIELRGIDFPLPPDSVLALRLSSIRRINAHYECSDTLVNQLWNNIVRSSLSNFISIPTDCPQRNERLGWMGDISVFAPTAMILADVKPILSQYLQSVRDCQESSGRFPDVAPTGFGFGGLLWGSAGITVPLTLFDASGDTTLLAEHYPSMKRYIDYIFADYIDPVTDIVTQHRAWGDLGDWLSPDYDADDKSLLWECYLIHDLDLMARAANLLGLTKDAEHYADLAESRRRHFALTYIDPLSERTRHSAFNESRRGQFIDTQASYALPIALNVYDSPLFREHFAESVVTPLPPADGKARPPYSLSTGFIATAWISEALTRIGRDDIAYRQLTNTHFPGWLYPITQGATSVWERLDSYTHTEGFGSNNRMNSFNHYSFGAIGHWLITRSLGINTRSDSTLVISPHVDPSGSITSASGWVDLPVGRISTMWEITSDAIIHTVNIPEGVDAKFQLPNQQAPIHLRAGMNTICEKRKDNIHNRHAFFGNI